MSTTFYCLRCENGGWLPTHGNYRSRATFGRDGAHAVARSSAVRGMPLTVVKVTRYTAAESRQRAEARGAATALQAALVDVTAVYDSECGVHAEAIERVRKRVQALLTDARKRAGIREASR